MANTNVQLLRYYSIFWMLSLFAKLDCCEIHFARSII